MSGYAPVNTSTHSPPSTPARSRRSSFASINRSSISFPRFSSRQPSQIPDPEEMDAAFDGPEDEEGNSEEHGLLSNTTPPRQTIPGDYDFERDYTQPPPSPPPFQPYSSHNPAPGNTNGIVPTSPASRPNPQRHFLGGILPSSFLPRSLSPNPSARIMGAGNAGVFNNLSARPGTGPGAMPGDGPEYAPEDEQKEGPPSYQAALRDTVPAYWETTVVLPSSSSPFGPLSSSMSGDEILIDGMPSGNILGFLWNVVVSVSFQFVGFLLTYVLHTTHAAKYGSRVGLGLTLVQFGFSLRNKAEILIETGRFPNDPSDPEPPAHYENEEEAIADNALKAVYGGGNVYPFPITDPDLPPEAPPVTIHNIQDAENFAHRHNMTLGEMFELPSAAEVGRANEYFSFFLMTIGWFIVLTSLGGWWRVKRFERGLRTAQRESEEAQQQAAAARNNPDSTSDPLDININSPTVGSLNDRLGPTSLSYYTGAFQDAFNGANEIRRGFLGQHGSRFWRGRGRGHGHEPLPNEIFDADSDEMSMGMEPMASESPSAEGRRRGLWGI